MYMDEYQQDDMDDDHNDGGIHSDDSRSDMYGDHGDDSASEASVYYDAVSMQSGEVTPRACAVATPRAVATEVTDDVPVGLPSGSTGNTVQFGGVVDSRFEPPTGLAYSGPGARDQRAEGSYTFSSDFQRTLPQRPSAIDLPPDVDMDQDLEGNPWSDNRPVLGKRGDRERPLFLADPSSPLNSSHRQLVRISRYSHSGSG